MKIYGANIGYIVKKQSTPRKIVTGEVKPEIFGANVGFTYKQKSRSDDVIDFSTAVVNGAIPIYGPTGYITTVMVEKQVNVEPVVEKPIVPEQKLEGWKSKREKRKSVEKPSE